MTKRTRGYKIPPPYTKQPNEMLDRVEAMRAIQAFEKATGKPHPNRPKYPELPPFDSDFKLDNPSG